MTSSLPPLGPSASLTAKTYDATGTVKLCLPVRQLTVSLGCFPQFNTNDLYEMSNMKQVILGLNALGRVSASVDGFEGPSLSAGIERTASVNRSGKVSRLSVNLKDKIKATKIHASRNRRKMNRNL